MKRKIMRYLDDLLLIIGIALLSIGAFKIYVPAGYITLGILFIASALLYAKKEAGEYD